MSSHKLITENSMVSYIKSYQGEYCFSLSLGFHEKEPCGFMNFRISPKELKGICEYLLKEINEMEKNDT
jgi:hypothetical protein